MLVYFVLSIAVTTTCDPYKDKCTMSSGQPGSLLHSGAIIREENSNA